MEEEEDDFYGGGGGAKYNEDDVAMDTNETINPKAEMSEDEDEDESDDDVQFTLEKPEGDKKEPPTKSQNKKPDRSISIEPAKPSKSTPVPTKQESQRAGSAAPVASVKGALTHNGKEGKDFPEIHTSDVDVNIVPKWPANGKPITEVDIDADLAEQAKPWRLPGTDQTDFFNYGFDEYTWTQYCVRQQMMSNTLSEQKQADAQMKAFFGGGAPGGGPVGGPAAMPGMPPGMPMPDPQQLMDMVNQGVIPQEFAQQMMQQMGGGMPGMGGQQSQFQQGGGFGQEQNGASPHPQAGQGFQPPTGPSGGGQQGAFSQANMEGYSAQQMAIMQQEQSGGGGGGRGRNRRGRGFY